MSQRIAGAAERGKDFTDVLAAAAMDVNIPMDDGACDAERAEVTNFINGAASCEEVTVTPTWTPSG